MNWPFVLRSDHEKKLAELEARLVDLERHFVTKRDEKGQVVQTLADVPVSERKELPRPRGANWPQMKRWLEATDGGRHAP